MNYKDLKAPIKFRDKMAQTMAQLTYMFKTRNSRPRVKKNILQPDEKQNNHCVVHDDQDYK